LVGGIDVYRHAPDDPKPLNKDWYAVIDLPEDREHLLVDGPQRDHEHWIDRVPPRLAPKKILK
jgi:hypothetical protein